MDKRNRIKSIIVYKKPGSTQSISSPSLWAIPVPRTQLTSNVQGFNYPGHSSSSYGANDVLNQQPLNNGQTYGGYSKLFFTDVSQPSLMFPTALQQQPTMPMTLSTEPAPSFSFVHPPQMETSPQQQMQAQQLPNQSYDVPLIELTDPEIMKSDNDSKASNTDAMVSVVGGRKRFKHNCPECVDNKALFDLPRHLREKHNYTHDDARYYVQNNGMRGRNFRNEDRINSLKTCGYQGCREKVLRLDLHLKSVHKAYLVKPKVNKRELLEEEEPDKKSKHKSVRLSAPPTVFMNLLKKVLDLYLHHKKLSVNKRVQHAARCRSLFELLRPASVTDILNENKLNAFFVEKFETGQWKANTIKHYILSFQKFLEYVESKNLIAMTEQQGRNLHSLIKDLPDWRDEYKDYVKQQKNELWKKRKEMLHNPDDVSKYLNSEEYKGAINLINKVKNSSKPMNLLRTQYNAILRNIITTFHLRCAKRAGIFGQIRVSDYEKKEMEKDEFVVNVQEHKTSGCYGDSSCVFSKFQCDCIDVYLKKIRSQVVNENSGEFLFLKFNGRKLTNTDVSNNLKMSWKAADIKKNTNSTVFRESIITEMYKNAPSEKEKQNAALLLDHDMSTGYKQYNIVLKSEKAVSAAKYASQLMRIDDAQRCVTEESSKSISHSRSGSEEKMILSQENDTTEKNTCLSSQFTTETFPTFSGSTEASPASPFVSSKCSADSHVNSKKVPASPSVSSKCSADSHVNSKKVPASPSKCSADSHVNSKKVPASPSVSSKCSADSHFNSKKVPASPSVSSKCSADSHVNSKKVPASPSVSSKCSADSHFNSKKVPASPSKCSADSHVNSKKVPASPSVSSKCSADSHFNSKKVPASPSVSSKCSADSHVNSKKVPASPSVSSKCSADSHVNSKKVPGTLRVRKLKRGKPNQLKNKNSVSVKVITPAPSKTIIDLYLI